MSRPTDWTALQQWDDPIPGDWQKVKTSATRYSGIAEAILAAKADLLAVCEDGWMEGDAIDAVREVAVQVADRIGRAHERYQGVATALAGYVEPLRSAQDASVSLLDQAESQRTDRNYARGRVDYWTDELNRLMYQGGDPQDAEEARQKLTYWLGRVSTAESDLWGLISQLNAVVAERDAAANAAADAIEDVESSGGLNDDVWDDVDQFLAEHGELIDQILTIAGYIAAALAVIALFVPGLNLLVLGVGIAIAAATILNVAAKVTTGRISIVEAVLTTALALVPFGVGKILGNAAKGPMNALRDVASTSVMRSAAGAGASGVTKAQALQIVDELINARRGIALTGSPVAQMMNVNQLSNMVLRSGLESLPVAAAAQAPLAWMIAGNATDVGMEFAGVAMDHEKVLEGIGEPPASMRNDNW